MNGGDRLARIVTGTSREEASKSGGPAGKRGKQTPATSGCRMISCPREVLAQRSGYGELGLANAGCDSRNACSHDDGNSESVKRPTVCDREDSEGRSLESRHRTASRVVQNLETTRRSISYCTVLASRAVGVAARSGFRHHTAKSIARSVRTLTDTVHFCSAEVQLVPALLLGAIVINPSLSGHSLGVWLRVVVSIVLHTAE